jgi:hypothetical protein
MKNKNTNNRFGSFQWFLIGKIEKHGNTFFLWFLVGKTKRTKQI